MDGHQGIKWKWRARAAVSNGKHRGVRERLYAKTWNEQNYRTARKVLRFVLALIWLWGFVTGWIQNDE